MSTEVSSCDLLSADDVTKLLFYFHKETFKLQTITLETHRQEVYFYCLTKSWCPLAVVVATVSSLSIDIRNKILY